MIKEKTECSYTSTGVYRRLSNEIDLMIIKYVSEAMIAMQSSIIRRLKLNQSTVAKHLNHLVLVEIYPEKKSGEPLFTGLMQLLSKTWYKRCQYSLAEFYKPTAGIPPPS